MRGQMAIIVPSERYGHEPGILLEFMDSIVAAGEVEVQTAYNYYMTARTLVKYLHKCRYGVEAPLDEVVLTRVSTEELLSITPDEWTGYLEYYVRTVRERAGPLAVRITVFRRLYGWLENKTGHPAPKFLMDTKRPKPSGGTQNTAASPHSVQEVISSLKGEFRARNISIVLLAARCGIGLDEIVDLDLEDVKLNSICVQGRSGRLREIPLDDMTKAMLDQYIEERIPPIDEGNPLFVSKKRGRLKRGAMQKMLRKAVRSTSEKTQTVTFRDLQQGWMRQTAELDSQGLIKHGRVGSRKYIKRKYLAHNGGANESQREEERDG